MSSLHDRLKAAIKERLAVAQKAGADGPAWSIHGLPLYTDPVLLASDGDMYTTLGTVDLEEHVRVHIEANGPDRIIRDCTEDLAVLDRHRIAPTGSHLFCGPDCQGGDCGSCRVNYPCIELKSLARRYGIVEPS